MSLSKPRKIEIFVVGGLIFGLWVVLYFSFERARDIQRGIACQSNLKQLGLAASQYIRDHDELYPLIDNWDDALIPYRRLKSISCPTTGQYGYAMNRHLSGVNETLITDSGTTPFFFETHQLRPNANGSSEAWLKAARHPQGIAANFHGFHVKWLQSPPQFRSFAPLKPKAKPKPKTQPPKGKTSKIN